jgi:hypothetical protein
MGNQTKMTAYYDTLWRTVTSAAGTRTVQPLHRDDNGQLVARCPARVYAVPDHRGVLPLPIAA